jgi:hypothetical protein
MVQRAPRDVFVVVVFDHVGKVMNDAPVDVNELLSHKQEPR